MKQNDLADISVPFKVREKESRSVAVVIGFSQNDPLGVGGGLFPSFQTVYFEGGGWLLLQDFLDNYTLVAPTKKKVKP
jgi:hypothetical protein